jgi:heterodisulfide reductase subunit A-like polyferredoxin/coenzyme F420-reducing hydrogenase delta subunit
MILHVCNCKGLIDIPEDMDFGSDVMVHMSDCLCTKEGRESVMESITDDARLVLAGCSPRILERFFGDIDSEMVNIREQGAFLGLDPDGIRRLISGGIGRARAAKPVEKTVRPVAAKSALVIGAGVAGLEAARRLAEVGNDVILVEEDPFVGGTVAKLDRLYPESTPNSHTLYPLINQVVESERIRLLTNARVESVVGGVGDYRVKLATTPRGVVECNQCGKCIDVCPETSIDHGVPRKAIYSVPSYPDEFAVDFDVCTLCGKCVEVCPGEIDLNQEARDEEIAVGAIVVATGLKSFDISKLSAYGGGKIDRVMRAIDYERKIAAGLIHPEKVLVVNCAGSRDENYLPYCSRVCCLIGMKEAKLTKDRFPDAKVYLSYIDMRCYGQFEYLYQTLRNESGVIFLEGRPSEMFERGDKVVVRTEDIQCGENIELEVDYVVLSHGFEPDRELLSKLGLPAEVDFPFQYVGSNLSPDVNPQGIFLAGSAAFPRGVMESLESAREAAASAHALLSKTSITLRTPVPTIESEVCASLHCKLCVSTCPYGALYIDEEEELKVNEALCMGCGICSATCPSGANSLDAWETEAILAEVDAVTDEGSIVAFLCKWSAYGAADQAGYERLSVPASARIIRIPCSGRVDAQMVAGAFARGAGSVLIGACYPDSCHYGTGNTRARSRVMLLRTFLSELGVDASRLRLEYFGTREGRKLASVLTDMDEQLSSVGVTSG